MVGSSTNVSTAPDEVKAKEKPSSIERIRRLEKLEEERLAEKERKEDLRRQRLAGEKPSGGRNDLVDSIERFTRYPMAVLGFAWLVLAVAILTTKLKGSPSTVLVGVFFGLWILIL